MLANWTVFRVILRLFVITSQVCDLSLLLVVSRTHTCTFCKVIMRVIDRMLTLLQFVLLCLGF